MFASAVSMTNDEAKNFVQIFPDFKKCISCGTKRLSDDFPHFSNPTAGRKNTCRDCVNESRRLRRKLRFINPPPTSGHCPICDKYTENWILDHCHLDLEFRGYICNDCNLGLGKFGDDIEILKKAIKYLKRKSKKIKLI